METMKFREIIESDIPQLFTVRTAVRENHLSIEQLAGMGITENSLKIMIRTSHRGWLCEAEGRVIGFSMGNRDTGEMWVIALLPGYEGRGIGARLMDCVETWLWSEGFDEIWLTTDIDPSLRAYGFYCHRGWIDSEIRDGIRFMKKCKPAAEK